MLKKGTPLYNAFTGKFWFRFREGPVGSLFPGTKGCACNIRKPKTLAARRAFERDKLEARNKCFKVRTKNNKTLPTDYDDIFSKKQRSWKNYRKTKYKCH
jgi:hypothetical protein